MLRPTSYADHTNDNDNDYDEKNILCKAVINECQKPVRTLWTRLLQISCLCRESYADRPARRLLTIWKASRLLSIRDANHKVQGHRKRWTEFETAVT